MPTARSIVVLLATILLAGLPSTASAGTCPLSESQKRNLGVKDGYVTSLKVSGTSCKRGKEVVRAFHACRYANGGKKARCPRAVLGYSCRENRDSIPTQYTSTVVCRKGGARVTHGYTQFT
jgi:hypothetical protein